MMTAKKFKQKIKKYAELIIKKGVNLLPGQYLVISALVVHRELALALAEQAYLVGASYVNIIYNDEKLQKYRLLHSEEENLTIVPDSIISVFKELIDKNGAYITITGAEDIQFFKKIIPARRAKHLFALFNKLNFFHEKITSNQIKWTVVAAATEGIAKKLYPHEQVQNSVCLFWNEIFKICRINKRNPIDAWDTHINKLSKLTEKLNDLRIQEIYFKGANLDLRIGLNQMAQWCGGRSISGQGECFLPNIPTEEVFTVPDYHRVNGWFKCTRPIIYKNIYIENIHLEFKDGKIKKMQGSQGFESLHEILFSEPGNGSLGEIALVDVKSPIFQSGLVFYNSLYDENASSHVALGSAYPECFFGISGMSKKQKYLAGFNQSKIHIDLMIGNNDTEVTAKLFNGKKIILMKNGCFLSNLIE